MPNRAVVVGVQQGELYLWRVEQVEGKVQCLNIVLGQKVAEDWNDRVEQQHLGNLICRVNQGQEAVATVDKAVAVLWSNETECRDVRRVGDDSLVGTEP